MVHSVSQFTSITSVVQSYVYLPNGEETLVTHIGIAQISPSFILTDVLCVPSFSFNLISISKLTKNLHYCLIFLGNCCFIQDLTQWSKIGLGRECNGLYLLQNSFVHIALTIKAGSSSTLWHIRLGHPSYSKFSLLRTVLDVNVSNKPDCCDVCHFSKQKRLPFVCSNHVSNKPFEVIHCDLWGPFTTCTFDGFKYFLTIVDDITSTSLPLGLENVFLGYPHAIKGYKALDIDSISVFISRDVQFYEQIFPFADYDTPSASFLDSFVFPHCVFSSCNPDCNSIPTPISTSTHVSSSISLPSVSVDSSSPAASLSTDSDEVPLDFAEPVLFVPSDSQPLINPPPTTLRRFARSHNPPTYLSDYSCKSINTKPASGLPYDVSTSLSYSHLGSAFHSFVMAVNSTPSEPASFNQAVHFPEWKATMVKETVAFEQTNT